MLRDSFFSFLTCILCMVPAVIQSFCWGLFGPTTSWQVKVRAFFAPFLIIQHLELICQRELVVFLDLSGNQH